MASSHRRPTPPGWPCRDRAKATQRNITASCRRSILAAISGLMKDFFDRTYYPVLDRINGRPYASLVCAGSDGHNAARQMIEHTATGWRLKCVAPPLIVCTHAQTPQAILLQKQVEPADLRRCDELGAALAAGPALGVS